jgi:beta-glucosidase
MENRTYRYFKGKPLYGFGYGLSYTHFAYSELKLARTSVKAGEPSSAQVTVRNDGEVAGDEVAELYLARRAAKGNPVLRGMARVHLDPGASQTVSFSLTPRDLSAVDEQGKRAVQPGGVFGDDRRRGAFGRRACDGKFCRDWFRADTGIAGAAVLLISG